MSVKVPKIDYVKNQLDTRAKFYVLTKENIDLIHPNNFDWNDYAIGMGLFEDRVYIAFHISWVTIQIRTASTYVLMYRVKWGNNNWTDWKEI